MHISHGLGWQSKSTATRPLILGVRPLERDLLTRCIRKRDIRWEEYLVRF